MSIFDKLASDRLITHVGILSSFFESSDNVKWFTTCNNLNTKAPLKTLTTIYNVVLNYVFCSLFGLAFKGLEDMAPQCLRYIYLFNLMSKSYTCIWVICVWKWSIKKHHKSICLKETECMLKIWYPSYAL